MTTTMKTYTIFTQTIIAGKWVTVSYNSGNASSFVKATEIANKISADGTTKSGKQVYRGFVYSN